MEEGFQPGWSMPKATILERYALEGLIDKYGEVYSYIHIGNKKNRILGRWDKRYDKGNFIAQQCRVKKDDLIKAIKNLRKGYCTARGYKYQLELICGKFRTEERIRYFKSHPTKGVRRCVQCDGDDIVEHIFLKCPMRQVSWEVVQEFLQKIFEKDCKLSVKNIILGTCNRKKLDGKERKFFLCVNAQVVALLTSMYYKQAKVGQDGLIRVVNWAIDLWLCLGLNKEFRTFLGKKANIYCARGPSLNKRLRVIEQAGKDDREIYKNGIWNTVFELWESKIVYVRNGEGVVYKLRSADDRAINEIWEYIGPCREVFRLLAPRRDNTEIGKEEMDRIQRKIVVGFNQQIAIARVALEETLYG